MSFEIKPEVRPIWNAARVIQTTIGFTLGIYLYIYGLFFFEKFGGDANPSAMKLTTFVLSTFGILYFLLEVPTGAIADYFGRRKTIIISFVFRSLYFFVLSWIPFVQSVALAFILAVIAVFFFGIGYTLFNGAFVSWIVDTLREKEVSMGHGPILSKSYSYSFWAQLIGAVIGLTLYMNHMVFLAFCLGFIACVLASFYCAFFMEESQTLQFQTTTLSWRQTFSGIKDTIVRATKVFRQSPMIFYLTVLFSFFMFLNHVVSYLWPVYMKSNFGFGKMSPVWYAIVILSIYMSILGASTLTRLNQNYLREGQKTPNYKYREWFTFSCLVASLPVAFLGYTTAYHWPSLVLLFGAVLINRGGYGFIRPTQETLLNNYIGTKNAKERATVMSFGNMLTSFLMVILTPFSGGSSGAKTAVGWLIPSTLVILLAIGLNFLMKRHQKKTGEIPSKKEEKNPLMATATTERS